MLCIMCVRSVDMLMAQIASQFPQDQAQNGAESCHTETHLLSVIHSYYGK